MSKPSSLSSRIPFSSLAAVLLVAVLSGCATYRPIDGEYYRGDYEGAIQRLSAVAAEKDENYALVNNEIASIRMTEGKWDDALHAILEAHRLIEDFSGDWSKEFLAIVGSEANKIYKGEPYERAMNAYYGGLLYAMQGDWDNGLAGFRNALFRDAGSRDPEFRGDFGPAVYFLAREELRNGDRQEADRLLDPLRKRFPKNPFVEAPDIANNVIVIVELGRGPRKIQTGVQGSDLRFQTRSGLTRNGPRVFVDQREVGKTSRLEDVYFQATTRGPREFAAVLEGKAVTKEVAEKAGIGLLWAGIEGHGSNDGAALVGLGGALFLVSQLIRAEADVRHWSCLPREIQVLELKLEPGTHVIDVWHGARKSSRTIDVRKRGDVVVYFRPDRQRAAPIVERTPRSEP